MMFVTRLPLALAALCALALAPNSAEAQWRRERDRDNDRERYRHVDHDRVPDREITMSVGALHSDDDHKSFPMAALRIDWRVRHWLTSELGVSYSIGTIDRLENGSTPSEERTLQLGTATIGLRAELPTPWVRPYVGVAGGIVQRHEEEGAQYVRTTMAFPAGLRLVLSDRVSLRGEARFRFDQRRRADQGVRIEQTGGLSVAF
ncbi:MAG: hypothetical protein ABIT38_05625 [Gemmatimonadaceae bacterium]